MVYWSLRILFVIISIIIYFAVLKKKAVRSKAYFGLVYAAMFLLTILPVDNIFVSFKAPESAYRYNHLGKAELVAEGTNSCLFVEHRKELLNYSTIPKEGDKWKADLGFVTQTPENRQGKNVLLYIKKCKNTNDYYISVLYLKGGTAGVKDNRNSEFSFINDYNNDLQENYYTYFAFIGDLSEDYTITVNEESFTFEHR